MTVLRIRLIPINAKNYNAFGTWNYFDVTVATDILPPTVPLMLTRKAVLSVLITGGTVLETFNKIKNMQISQFVMRAASSLPPLPMQEKD